MITNPVVVKQGGMEIKTCEIRIQIYSNISALIAYTTLSDEGEINSYIMETSTPITLNRIVCGSSITVSTKASVYVNTDYSGSPDKYLNGDCGAICFIPNIDYGVIGITAD